MINNLITLQIETNDFIISATKDELNGVSTTGFVELEYKDGSQNNIIYTLFGQINTDKPTEYNQSKLLLVHSDLRSFSVYEMTLNLYEEFIFVNLLELSSGKNIINSKGKYSKKKTKSEYSIQHEQIMKSALPSEIEQLELTVNKVIHKQQGDLETYYIDSDINVSKFLITYEGGADEIRAFDSDGELVLRVAVFTKRIDNMFKHVELNMNARNNEDNTCFMNCLYLRKDKLESNFVMILRGTTYLFQCQVDNLGKEAEASLINKLPVID